MSEIENKKRLFEPKIPDATEEDVQWAKRINKSWFMISSSKLKEIVGNNQIWRLNFLHEKYKDKLDLSHHYNRRTGSCEGESLFGYAVEKGHGDMALLLSDWKATMRRPSSIWEQVIDRKSRMMAYALLQYKEVDSVGYFHDSLARHAYKIAQVFVDLGTVNYNDGLVRMVSNNNFEGVKFLVKKGVDISANDYAAIKEADDNGYFEIAGYLKENAGLIEKEALALPAPVLEAGTDLYEKISDVELLKTSVSENGSMTLTTVFNFEMEDVVRTQYVAGQAPSETHRKFNDFDDKVCLKAMFDELCRRDGHPPSGMFKNVDKRVKIKKLNSV